MRAFKVFGLLMVLILVVTACAPAAAPAAPAAGEEAAAGGEVKVAILAPLSGPVPTFGVSTRDGALLAIKEWNEKGGVLGKKIVPIVEDSQCTPDPAVNAANKVINQDKVKFIIGEVCSKASIPVSEIADAAKVIQISPTSTAEALTLGADGKAKPFIFRACFIDPFQGTVGANFALETLKAKTAFVMVDQANDYVKGLAENFDKAFKAKGGEIVGTESYTSKDTDFSAILAKVAEANPDVIYLPDYYNIVNLAAKQAKEKGITAPFIGGDGYDSPDLDMEAADGSYFTNHYASTDPRPEVQNLLKAYAAEYDGAVPDALAVLAYDAVNMLMQSIEEADTADDTVKISGVIATKKFDLVSGSFTLDEFHNPTKSAALLQVKDGKVEFHSSVNP